VYGIEHDNQLLYRYACEYEMTYVSFSRTPHYVLSAYADGSVIMHDLVKKGVIGQYHYASLARKIIISQDKAYIASIHDDNTIVVYSVQEKKNLCEISHVHPEENLFSINIDFFMFSPDNRYVALGCSCGKVIVYDIQKNKKIFVNAHERRITGLLFSKDGSKIFSSAKEKVVEVDIQKAFRASIRETVYLTHASKGSVWWVYEPDFHVRHMKLSKDKKLLAVSGFYDVILYNIISRQEIVGLDYLEDNDNEDELELRVNGTLFANYKNQLLIFGEYFDDEGEETGHSSLSIIDLKDLLFSKEEEFKEAATFDFDESLYGVFFSKSGRFLAVIGKSVHVFDLEILKEVYSYRLGFAISDEDPELLDIRFSGRFSRDMDKLVLVNNDKLSVLKISSDIFFKEKTAMLEKPKVSLFKRNLFALTEQVTEEKSKKNIKNNKKFTDIIIKTTSEKKPNTKFS